MADDALQRDLPPARAEAATLASGLRSLLALEPDERAPRRLVAVLAGAIPHAACLALAVASDADALELVAGVGLDERTPERFQGGLGAEALRAGSVCVSADPGPPFPDGTRAGAAIAAVAGSTRAVLLLGVPDALADEETLLLLRAGADRAALLLEAARLARERDEAAAAARRAEDELERRRRAVDMILGIVGHDLRNPLGAVHMSAALLMKRGGLEGWQARTVERMRSSVGRMNRIIADLLSYTRTRLGTGIPIQRREADLAAVVGRVVDELRAANPDREITIAAQGDLCGAWDPDRLEQVASNLLSNAVDHGDPERPVCVTLIGGERDVALTVRNEGPAMPPEVLEHLFEPFSRPPDERSRKASGLGLGLYIAREIVRGHGGEITAEARDGETSVTVRLPRG